MLISSVRLDPKASCQILYFSISETFLIWKCLWFGPECALPETLRAEPWGKVSWRDPRPLSSLQEALGGRVAAPWSWHGAGTHSSLLHWSTWAGRHSTADFPKQSLLTPTRFYFINGSSVSAVLRALQRGPRLSDCQVIRFSMAYSFKPLMVQRNRWWQKQRPSLCGTPFHLS